MNTETREVAKRIVANAAVRLTSLQWESSTAVERPTRSPVSVGGRDDRYICGVCLVTQRYGNGFCANCDSRELRRASEPVSDNRKQ